MKRIRIAYTIPNFDTAGSGIALMKLATRLDRNLFEPVIVCLHDRGAYFEEVRRSGIRYVIHPYLSELTPRMTLARNVIRISKFFRELDPDIVFSYHYASNFSEAVAARLAGKKFVYVKKNMGWKGPSYNQWRVKTWMSQAVVAQNSDMVRDFFYGSPKAHLISIGVDQAEFHPRPKDKALTTELGLTEDKPVILCVANLIPKKGIDYLIKGFSLCAEKVDAQLVIVGNNDTFLREETEELVRSQGMQNRITFTGKRSDVHRFHSIASLFILPSTGDEGAPIAIQEAMASGVPVVTTDTPGNRDQLRELPGQIIPPSDSQAIADAIIGQLAMDGKERDAIITRQLEIVSQRYSLEEEVRRHESLYRSLMQK